MISIFDPLRDINFLTTLFRMVFAFFVGGLIGLERSYKNRPAGFRTHILVCLGATIASLTGIYLYLVAQLPLDIARIGASVVTGLGFIGGGTIMVTKKNTVKGLTTAAGLWTTGIIGLAIGAGFYEGAFLAALLVLVTEIYFAGIGRRIKRVPDFKAVIQYNNKESLDYVLRYFKSKKMAITNLQITANTNLDEAVYAAIVSLKPSDEHDKDQLMRDAKNMEGVIFADVL